MTKVFLTFLVVFFFTLPIFAQSVDTAWVRRYNGPGNDDDRATSIVIDSSGNVYVTGYSAQGRIGSFPTNYDFATIKYYPDGDTVWVRRYNSPRNSYDLASAIAVDVSGNVYVTGGAGVSGTYSYDYATIKYAPDGNELWVRFYDGSGNWDDLPTAIAIDIYGNIYVTGYSYGSNATYDYATIKYYPNGDTAWIRRYDGLENQDDKAYAIAVDGSSNVYVTGYSGDSVSLDADYATIKYDSNGNELWVKRYNGRGGLNDGAYAIAVDGSGNVYVTGYSAGSSSYPYNYDYATIKYDASGNELWVKRYDGPYLDDFAYAIAVDGSGNVYVTGENPYDYATIKYYPNGDTAWVRIYKGPGSGSDEAYAIAVDGSGNIYVTGRSRGSGTSFDYATIKYYPNGDTAWVRRYNGSSSGWDEACALVVDGSGNIYVTGFSDGIGTYADYATIKYVQTPNDIRDETVSVGRPSEFALLQNYPNPFNPLTTISYTVEREGLVRLIVYNILGQKVRTLINERRQKGSYSAPWDGRSDKGEELPSGVYFYLLKVGDYTSSKKMILLK